MSVKITLLPVSTMGEQRRFQKRPNNGSRQCASKGRHTGLRETLGLLALALAMAYQAYKSSAFSLLWTIPDDVKDYLLGAVFVIGAIVSRMLVQSFSQEIQQALNKTSLESFGTRLTRVASSSTNLSVWKSTSNLLSVAKHTRGDKKQPNVLSASEPFVSLDVVEKLSLMDVTRVFQYATEYNKEKGLETDSDSSPALKQVLEAMDRATSSSRGDTTVSPSSDDTGVDALLLCAALRIFAEWRVLSHAPKSFNKGYEMGVNLGKRDLIQNVHKIETAIHQYHQQHSKSPTVKELLEFEVSNNFHPSLPKLSNESAAMGLLWAKRQVDFQASVYSNLMDEMDSQAAFKTAYKQVFSQYHGWWIQQMFHQSYRSAPSALEIYETLTKHYIPTRPSSTTTEETVPYWMESSISSFDDTNISDVSYPSHDDEDLDVLAYTTEQQEPPVECQLFGLQLWDKATQHVQKEWNNFVEGTVALFQGNKSPPRLTTHAVQQHESRSNLEMVDRRSAFALLKTPQEDPIQQVAHQHFTIFLEKCQPMIQELSELLEKNNMNDPTKV